MFFGNISFTLLYILISDYYLHTFMVVFKLLYFSQCPVFVDETFRQRDCTMLSIFLTVCFFNMIYFLLNIFTCLHIFLTVFYKICICFWKFYISDFWKQISLQYRSFLLYLKNKTKTKTIWWNMYVNVQNLSSISLGQSANVLLYIWNNKFSVFLKKPQHWQIWLLGWYRNIIWLVGWLVDIGIFGW